MNRELWTCQFQQSKCPPWPCPHCRKGTLAIVPKTFGYEETVSSKQGRQHEAWEVEWLDYRFLCWTSCGTCKGRVAVVGRGKMEQVEGEKEWECEMQFNAETWSPMPHLFEVPERCPDDVKEALDAAFKVHAVERASCAGRLRVALELLMNHAGVPRARRSKNRKLVRLTLHERLTAYLQRHPEFHGELMALKWLGNAGSHEGGIAEHEIFDALEIFENLIAEIVGKRRQRLAGLAKTLTWKYSKKRRPKPPF